MLFCHFLWAVLCALSPSDDRLEAAPLPLVNLVLEMAAVWLSGQTPFLSLSLSNPELLRTVIGEQEEISITFQICVFRSVTFTGTQAWTP